MRSPSYSKRACSARRSLTTLLAVLAASVLPVACGGGGDAGGATVWRFAIEEAAGSVQDAYAQEFKRLIEARSAGEVEVKVYPYGTLGTSDDLTEQLRMGSLQFAMASPGHLGKTIPEVQVFLLHFVFSDDDDVNLAAISDRAFRDQLDPLFPEKGLELLSILPEGWMVWTTQRAIHEPADFAGVKIRTMTSPLLLAAYEAYGASPQAMPYGEVYSALQLNMIDAQVNPVFAIEEMSFYEVTSHMIFSRPAPFLTTLVSDERFLGRLEPERRELVEGVVSELDVYLHDVQRRMNAERLERIRERKPDMVMIEFDEAERERFRQLALPVRETYRAEVGERGSRLLDALLAAIERAQNGD
ncbi:MAG: TRAP transporter substrate-binding protein DctP [Planctomycetota bacterium]